MKFMISCDEATAICDKNQYGEASFKDKIKLSFHLFLCKFCKTYSKQNVFMTGLYEKYMSPCGDKHKLSEVEKQSIASVLKKEIKDK